MHGKENMRRVKAYFLFTGWRYKLGIFLGLPTVVLTGGLLWRRFLAPQGYGIFVTLLVIFIEVLTDQGVFAGIQSHSGYKLDYLKTSPAGPKVLRQGLAGDLVRRMLTALLCAGICGIVDAEKAVGGWAGYLGMALVIYGMEALGLLISRFTRSAVLRIWIIYGCMLLGVLLYFLVWLIGQPAILIMDGILALGAAAASIAAVRTAMKKWLQTYLDGQEALVQ